MDPMSIREDMTEQQHQDDAEPTNTGAKNMAGMGSSMMNLIKGHVAKTEKIAVNPPDAAPEEEPAAEEPEGKLHIVEEGGEEVHETKTFKAKPNGPATVSEALKAAAQVKLNAPTNVDTQVATEVMPESIRNLPDDVRKWKKRDLVKYLTLKDPDFFDEKESSKWRVPELVAAAILVKHGNQGVLQADPEPLATTTMPVEERSLEEQAAKDLVQPIAASITTTATKAEDGDLATNVVVTAVVPEIRVAQELVIYVDCMPGREPVQMLEDILAPIQDEVANWDAPRDEGIPDDVPRCYTQFKYNKGPQFVASVLRKHVEDMTGAIYVDSSSPCAAACIEVLARHANVIRPTR